MGEAEGVKLAASNFLLRLHHRMSGKTNKGIREQACGCTIRNYSHSTNPAVSSDKMTVGSASCPPQPHTQITQTKPSGGSCAGLYLQPRVDGETPRSRVHARHVLHIGDLL